MVAGWPGRAGRASFGPTMRDERPTVDSEREFNAAQANLSFWQLGAMGLIAPKAVMQFEPPIDDNPKLRHGDFSWDQEIYAEVYVPDFPVFLEDFVINATGDYTVTFANQTLGRPDEDGVRQMEVLDFQFAFVDANPGSGNHATFAEVTLVSPQEFNIFTNQEGAPKNVAFTLVVF